MMTVKYIQENSGVTNQDFTIITGVLRELLNDPKTFPSRAQVRGSSFQLLTPTDETLEQEVVLRRCASILIANEIIFGFGHARAPADEPQEKRVAQVDASDIDLSRGAAGINMITQGGRAFFCFYLVSAVMYILGNSNYNYTFYTLMGAGMSYSVGRFFLYDVMKLA